jgi:peptidoglycan/LPS O-acetylase OafA/YrhL
MSPEDGSTANDRQVPAGDDLGSQRPPWPERSTPTVLRGRRLTIARAVCVAMTLLAVVLFVVGLLPSFEEFRTLSVYEGAAVREITRANLDRLGLSVEFYAAYYLILGVALAVVCFALAALIFRRKSEELMALFATVMLVLLGATYSGSTQALDALNPVLGWAGAFLEELSTSFLFLFFFLFPDGRFVPRWTRYAAAVLVALTIPPALFPNSPVGSDNWPGLFYVVYMLGWFFMGVFAQVYRYRRVSGPTERQQTKWVFFGLTVALAGYVGIVALGVFFPTLEPGTIADFLVAALGAHLSFLFIPLSIGIAILRYRLWDIDVIIKRSLVYGSLSTVLAAVFAITNTLLPSLVQSILGEEDSSLNTVISAVIIAVLFEPLRRRINKGVNKLSDWVAGGDKASQSPRLTEENS